MTTQMMVSLTDTQLVYTSVSEMIRYIKGLMVVLTWKSAYLERLQLPGVISRQFSYLVPAQDCSVDVWQVISGW